MSETAHSRQMPCMVCNGRGFHTCGACHGGGVFYISKTRLRFDRTLEFYQDRLACTGCFSSGRTSCPACQGAGWMLQSERLADRAAASELHLSVITTTV